MTTTNMFLNFGGKWDSPPRGPIPKTNEIVTHICSCITFFPLSSVQIIIIPASCLLCVL